LAAVGLQRFADSGGQYSERKWLQDEFVLANATGTSGDLAVRVARHEQHWQVGPRQSQAPRQLATIDARHDDVREEQVNPIERVSLQVVQHTLAVGVVEHLVSMQAQRFSDELANVVFVVDEEDGGNRKWHARLASWHGLKKAYVMPEHKMAGALGY
jgi:hypothetical protein